MKLPGFRIPSQSFRLVFASSLALVPIGAACSSDDPEPDPYVPWTLEDLTAEEGFSIRIPEFHVGAGEEIQDCYFIPAPDLDGGQDYWVSRFHSGINPGSHHMNVFRVRTIVGLDPAAGEPLAMGSLEARVIKGGECWKSPNWADWPLFVNTQNSDPTSPYTDWTLPEGVAFRVTPGEMLMVQTHYVNATTQTTPFSGKVGINFHRYAGSSAPIEMGTLFATQQSIRICQSNPAPTYSGTCRFGTTEDVTVAAANGHFHSRGKMFDVFTWDGVSDSEPPESSRFYQSDRWDDPPMVYGMDVKPPQNGGIWWNCEYQWIEPEVGCDAVNSADKQNAGDCCYTFGPKVETSEHCNVFLYYYPKIERSDIFCN